MKSTVEANVAKLKACSSVMMVIGDSVIQKQILKVDELISAKASTCGFTVVEIVSSDLAGHSKLFNPAFTQRGKREPLIFLRKHRD